MYLRIKQLREEAGLTLEELGKKLNVGKSTARKYEVGDLNLNASTLATLSEIFEVSIDYMLGLTDDRGIRKAKKSAPKNWSNEEINKIVSALPLDKEDVEMATQMLSIMLSKEKYKPKKDMSG